MVGGFKYLNPDNFNSYVDFISYLENRSWYVLNIDRLQGINYYLNLICNINKTKYLVVDENAEGPNIGYYRSNRYYKVKKEPLMKTFKIE